ncbi:MAG: DUF192 domain-containing protein [Bacteroidota bacterium]
MRKFITTSGYSLLILAICMLVLSGCKSGGKDNSSFSQPLEPKFVKEGSLTLIDKESQEAIRQINIEIADDPESIEIGLMYRRNMSDSQGMLFIFPSSEPRSFWMRNTYISLDLIFIDSEQRIVNIQKNAPPMSDKSQPSTAPAQYVLEVIGGFSDKYGLEAGDLISFERIKNPA